MEGGRVWSGHEERQHDRRQPQPSTTYVEQIPTSVASALSILTDEVRKLRGLVIRLLSAEEQVMATLDDLKTQVESNVSVEASAITLIKGIAQQLADAGADPAKLAALQDQLKSSADALAAAVAANTPAA